MKTPTPGSIRTPRRLLSIVALLGTLGVAGCSGDDPADGQPDDPTLGLSEVEAHAAEECPAELAQPEGDAADDPATEAPSLPAPESAYVCFYDPSEDFSTWRLADAPVAVPDADLPTLARQIANLAPPATDGSCGDGRGTRWLLVSTVGDDLTGIVVDDFGCASVRLSDNPFENAPGEATQEGTVPGVLRGSDELLNQLKLIWIDS